MVAATVAAAALGVLFRVRRARTLAGIKRRLHDKVVLVTGATTGLGVELARIACEADAHVVVAARDKKRLGELAIELGATAIAYDASAADVEAAAKTLVMEARAASSERERARARAVGGASERRT